MLRNFVVLAVVALLPAFAMAQPSEGDWELTLTGNGGSNHDFDTTQLGASASLGYFIMKPLEVGIRQSMSYATSDSLDEDLLGGSTRLFVDWHFDLDAFQPFVGASLGYAYGDFIDEESCFAGLEAGLKYFLHKDTFIYGLVEYQWLLDEGCEEGEWVYSLGIGTLLN